MEERLVYQDMPGSFPNMNGRGCQTSAVSDGFRQGRVDIHHLAHAYSAFAVSPLKMAL